MESEADMITTLIAMTAGWACLLTWLWHRRRPVLDYLIAAVLWFAASMCAVAWLGVRL